MRIPFLMEIRSFGHFRMDNNTAIYQPSVTVTAFSHALLDYVSPLLIFTRTRGTLRGQCPPSSLAS